MPEFRIGDRVFPRKGDAEEAVRKVLHKYPCPPAGMPRSFRAASSSFATTASRGRSRCFGDRVDTGASAARGPMTKFTDLFQLGREHGFDEGVRYAALRLMRRAEALKDTPLPERAEWAAARLREVAAELAGRAGDDELKAFIREDVLEKEE